MTRLAPYLALFVLVSAFPVPAQEAGSALPAWELPADPEAVVVRYQRVIGELEDADRGPSVTIHANGRMVVHYPAYMKRAGDYETFLARDQVEAIVESLLDKQVAEIDPERVAAEAEASEAETVAGTGNFVWASDYTITVIELRLDGFEPAGATAETPQDLHKTIRWQGLQSQARQRPSVRSLQDLAAAAQELEGLMTHEALERTDR